MVNPSLWAMGLQRCAGLGTENMKATVRVARTSRLQKNGPRVMGKWSKQGAGSLGRVQ